MQLSVEFTSADGNLKLRASGSQVVFAGYLKAFEDFDTGKEGSSGKHTAFGSALGSAFGSAIGSAFGSAFGSAIGSAFGSAFRSAIGSAIGSAFGFAFGAAFGSAFGSDFGSVFGFTIGNSFHYKHPLPRIHDLLDRLQGARVLNSVVCHIGFKSFDEILCLPTAKPPSCLPCGPTLLEGMQSVAHDSLFEIAPLLNKLCKDCDTTAVSAKARCHLCVAQPENRPWRNIMCQRLTCQWQNYMCQWHNFICHWQNHMHPWHNYHWHKLVCCRSWPLCSSASPFGRVATYLGF